MSAFSEQAARLKKPRPRLLDKRDRAAMLALKDRVQRVFCKQRSGGQCEVITVILELNRDVERGWFVIPTRRCSRRASQNHHLIGGSGRRNKGRSILAKHRLDTCDRCHEEITNHVLVPVDGTQREDAATVRYERVR